MGRMAGLLIGDVAKRTGVTAPTIRYYEGIGLLPSPARSGAGYRRYSDGTIEELRFIRKAQGLGFTLDEIAEILQLSRSGKAPCSHVLSMNASGNCACSAGSLQRMWRSGTSSARPSRAPACVSSSPTRNPRPKR